jgi:hypothetical protein
MQEERIKKEQERADRKKMQGGVLTTGLMVGGAALGGVGAGLHGAMETGALVGGAVGSSVGQAFATGGQSGYTMGQAGYTIASLGRGGAGGPTTSDAALYSMGGTVEDAVASSLLAKKDLTDDELMKLNEIHAGFEKALTSMEEQQKARAAQAAPRSAIQSSLQEATGGGVR